MVALAALGATAALWGAHNVAARWLLAGRWEQPGEGPRPPARAPSPAGLTAERGVLGGSALALAAAWDRDADDAAEALEPGRGGEGGVPPAASPSAPAGARGSDLLLRAGAEIALYDFLGMALEAWALSEGPDGAPHTTAIRASFFAAVTSVLVPPLAGLSGERVSRAQAAGCALAAAGAALFALDQGSQAPPGALDGLAAGLSSGDGAILGAAFFWAAFTVRLSALARRPGARVVGISAARALVSLAFALVWAAWEASEDRLDWGSYLDWGPLSSGGAALLPLAVLLYTALGSGALASTLQAYGQRGVGSAPAQVVLSTTPLFTTALALALGLPGEGLGAAGAAGGGFIVAGSILGSGVLKGRQAPIAGKEASAEDAP